MPVAKRNGTACRAPFSFPANEDVRVNRDRMIVAIVTIIRLASRLAGLGRMNDPAVLGFLSAGGVRISVAFDDLLDRRVAYTGLLEADDFIDGQSLRDSCEQ